MMTLIKRGDERARDEQSEAPVDDHDLLAERVIVRFVPANTTPENSALMNVSGTTTIATMRRRLDAFAL